jgi:hypothetical protein
MDPLDERVGRELEANWHARAPGRQGRAYRCRCGRLVFFRNSQCLGCGAALGYAPDRGEVRSLAPAATRAAWVLDGVDGARRYRRCANFETAAGCNWLVAERDGNALCISCRLTRTIPDQDIPEHRQWWRALEVAKRRMVSQLLALELPVRAKDGEDPERGLAFDLLRSPPGGPRVLTGHAGGVITLNVEEADDARREAVRLALHEPYRTLLGHFRHEVGHYYWDRLVAGTSWLAPYRELFGDERADYAAALRANYEQGPPPDWRDRFVTSYASSHPWEDWAESWAHYLHVLDSLETALGFGLSALDLDTDTEPFVRADLWAPDDPGAAQFLFSTNSWIELTTVLNELSHSMGEPDFYPFVLSRSALRKLQFVQMVISGSREPRSEP